uniref:2-hydroxyglutaryl-CoA dehydratase n=1 Tax=Desulfobacca acetoxidans TaxID=60893 RepID=A0A7C3WHP9_9BACT
MYCGNEPLKERARIRPRSGPPALAFSSPPVGRPAEKARTAGLCPSPSTYHSGALGLDFGSRYVKLVYGTEGGVMVRRKLDSLDFYRDILVRDNNRLDIDWPRLGLPVPRSMVITGYGKNLLREHFPTITEVRASFMGARQQTGLAHFILLEMGGQDTKVIYVRDGRVFDFLTNDRCAAGTGRYLENMSRFLKIPLREFAAYRDEPADISQTCAIFGESELVGLLLEGVPLARIAAGVNASVARRILALVRRFPCPLLVFTGGVAKNRAIVQMLREEGNLSVIVPTYPQFTGALGCFLEARNRLAKVGHGPAAE